jgi:hypothetical protein
MKIDWDFASYAVVCQGGKSSIQNYGEHFSSEGRAFTMGIEACNKSR